MAGKHNKFKERSASSSIKRELKSREILTTARNKFIVLSFKDFDRNQGQSFENWETDKLLALAVNKLRSVCELTRIEATQKKIIKEYTKGQFPPNSEFEHPKHISNDIAWCSMHIQGKECIIGYFEDNIFNIVFLDKEHTFWITEKKHT
jgi:hypothetical protein